MIRFTLSILAFMLWNASFSATYHTYTNGSWNDPTIWSTDGGTTSCNCLPPTTTNGNDIYINHIVNMTSDVSITNGSYFYVAPAGQLAPSGGSTYDISVRGNTTVLDAHGKVSINRLTNGSSATNGGKINIFNTFEVKAQIRLNSGMTNVDGGYLYMPSGNFRNEENSTFNLLNGAKLELFGGNIRNSGQFSICTECCAESSGNWTNFSSGSISGGGSLLTSLGNISNDGTFGTSLTWCSAGADSGIPTAEDCSISGTTCGIVALPVELTSFEGIPSKWKQ